MTSFVLRVFLTAAIPLAIGNYVLLGQSPKIQQSTGQSNHQAQASQAAKRMKKF